MRLNKSQGNKIETENKSKDASPSRSDLPGILLIGVGLLLVVITPIVIWLFREELTNLSPQALKNLWFGAGGMALLYLVAGLPLGAILLALGAAHLFPSSKNPRRILLPLLGFELVYFILHAIMAFRYSSVPFLFFALMGCLVVGLFLALVWVWAHKRPGLEAEQQRVADLQLGAGMCFFNSAWQTCGLTGAPGFALYPSLVEKLDNQSFIIGQSVAVQVFTVLGFVFLLLAMRAQRTH